MIQWIYGESGVGKTALARQIQSAAPNCVHLDGDDMRRVWDDLGFSEEDRRTQNLRVAHLARVLERQGFNVVVSTICPEHVRQEVKRITNCVFIHVESDADVKSWP